MEVASLLFQYVTLNFLLLMILQSVKRFKSQKEQKQS